MSATATPAARAGRQALMAALLLAACFAPSIAGADASDGGLRPDEYAAAPSAPHDAPKTGPDAPAAPWFAPTPDPDALRADLAAFKNTPDAALAQAAVQQAEAMLGAALLARQTHDAQGERAALNGAREKLEEARATARAFRRQHGDALLARQRFEAAFALVRPSASGSDGAGANDGENAPPRELTDAGIEADHANESLRAAIRAFGRGELNRAREAADKARQGFEQALALLAPVLADRTETTLRQAMRAGARRFAPRTLEEARTAFGELRAWIDGIAEAAPADPARALRLARLCARLTAQVKRLRKEKGVLEKLLRARIDERAAIAQALGVEGVDAPVAVPDGPALAQAAQRLHDEKLALETRCRAERERLQRACEAEIGRRLDAQKAELLAASQEQLARIKDAFRAKLERETFETRRLKKLRALFAPGEAVILARADGSLLIRLSALKFAPGKAGIARKYRDLLRRVARAMQLYADRKARIEGHTDNQGDVKYNQRLSLKRAEAVRDFLIAAGVDAGRLKALGYGEVRPIASNEFAKGREMNRRIDIVIEAPAKAGR